MDNNINISWYAKHMAKSLQELIAKKNNFDFVIEVLDARAPITTHNQELVKIFEDKIFIKIALKKDLSSYESSKFYDILFASIKFNDDRKKIIDYINKALTEKRNNLIKKGLVNPTFYGLIIGIPNTGKSSLINFLASKNVVSAQNKPGVTRKIANVKISENLFLVDTPGIFFKKVEDYETGLKLALLNSINIDLFPYKDVAQYCFEKVIKTNLSLKKIYLINDKINFDSFVNNLCKKQGFILKNNQLDIERGYKFVLTDPFLKKNVKIFMDF